MHLVLAAEITAGEFAAIIAAVALVFVAAFLLLAVNSLLKTLRQLRLSLEQFNREAVPLVGDLRSTVGQANAELVRVDGLLGTAESISGTLDSASRLAYLFFANPVVKAMAFGAGTARAARRLRRAPR